MSEHAPAIHLRDEYEKAGLGAADTGDVARRLSAWERFSNLNSVRKLSILVALVVIWELYTQASAEFPSTCSRRSRTPAPRWSLRCWASTCST